MTLLGLGGLLRERKTTKNKERGVDTEGKIDKINKRR